jgi:hypothetical protein
VYDNQIRSMLQSSQRYSRAGNQNDPSPAASPNPDGFATVYFAPVKPEGVNEGNWMQTASGQVQNSILRFYSPLEPFFTKRWRPGEIEVVH